MNSKKCKQLRHMIYGYLSQRLERSYITAGQTVSKMVPGKDKDKVPVLRHFRVNQTINDPESPRGLYLAAKKRYKNRHNKVAKE